MFKLFIHNGVKIKWGKLDTFVMLCFIITVLIKSNWYILIKAIRMLIEFSPVMFFALVLMSVYMLSGFLLNIIRKTQRVLSITLIGAKYIMIGIAIYYVVFSAYNSDLWLRGQLFFDGVRNELIEHNIIEPSNELESFPDKDKWEPEPVKTSTDNTEVNILLQDMQAQLQAFKDSLKKQQEIIKEQQLQIIKNTKTEVQMLDNNSDINQPKWTRVKNEGSLE